MNTQFLGKFIVNSEIFSVTGLHIGGSTTGFEIGGVDNPVIKDPLTDRPYIPGSGLKGKLRTLTEWSFGLIAKHQKHNSYAAYDCHELMEPRPGEPEKAKRWDYALAIGKLYGAASDDTKVRTTAGPSRLIVRDAFLTENSIKEIEAILGKGTYTEVKTENALDRVTSEANPRPIERAIAGSRFASSIIVDIYSQEDKVLLKDLFMAMRLLENSSLGGSGSRGHGQIRFDGLKLFWRPLSYYKEGQAEVDVQLPGGTLEEIIKGFATIKWPF